MAPKRIHCVIDSSEAPYIEIKDYDDTHVQPKHSKQKKGRTKVKCAAKIMANVRMFEGGEKGVSSGLTGISLDHLGDQLWEPVDDLFDVTAIRR